LMSFFVIAAYDVPHYVHFLVYIRGKMYIEV